jgi:hypothetical protein
MEYNKQELIERYSKYLDKMCNELHFYETFYEAYDVEDAVACWDESYVMEDEFNCWFGNGCTRLVMGDDNCDYVIKFQRPCDEIDYGALEVSTYEAAVAAGYADKFVWCDHLMAYEYEGDIINVYVYKYAQCSYDMISDDSYDYHFRAFCEQEGIDYKDDKSCDEWYRKDGDYTSTRAMLEFAGNFWHYNTEQLSKFIDFLAENHVNDLHCGNWGYDNNMLVLTDYAGYGEVDARSDIRQYAFR